MSKKVLSVALLAVLGTMAVGCQKESITELRPETSISEAGTVYTVQYAVNGVLHTETLHSEEEYNALLMQLMALSRSGAVVEISDDNYSPMHFLPKNPSLTPHPVMRMPPHGHNKKQVKGIEFVSRLITQTMCTSVLRISKK